MIANRFCTDENTENLFLGRSVCCLVIWTEMEWHIYVMRDDL